MEKKKTDNRLSAFRAVPLLLLLILAAVIITAGCVTPQTTESNVVPNIEGDWTAMGIYRISGIDGFSEVAKEDMHSSDFAINQEDRLLDIKIGDGDGALQYYAAIYDKDAKRYFSDATLPSANRYIAGNILSENVIIESVVNYNPETKEYEAFYVPLIKKGAAINMPSEMSKYNLVRSGTADSSINFFDGAYSENEYTINLKITENKGPLFTGSFESADASKSVKLVGTVSAILAEDTYTALVITESGNTWKAYITPDRVSLSRVDGSVYTIFVTDGSNPTPMQLPEFSKYSGLWEDKSAKSLGILGYSDISGGFPMEIEVGVGNTVIMSVSPDNTSYKDRTYHGMINRGSRISASGIFADEDRTFTMEGFFGDDGKLYTYSTFRLDDGETLSVIERIYTKKASHSSGIT